MFTRTVIPGKACVGLYWGHLVDENGNIQIECEYTTRLLKMFPLAIRAFMLSHCASVKGMASNLLVDGTLLMLFLLLLLKCQQVVTTHARRTIPRWTEISFPLERISTVLSRQAPTHPYPPLPPSPSRPHAHTSPITSVTRTSHGTCYRPASKLRDCVAPQPALCEAQAHSATNWILQRPSMSRPNTPSYMPSLATNTPHLTIYLPPPPLHKASYSRRRPSKLGLKCGPPPNTNPFSTRHLSLHLGGGGASA